MRRDSAAEKKVSALINREGIRALLHKLTRSRATLRAASSPERKRGTIGIRRAEEHREDNRAAFGGNAGTNDIGATGGSWTAQGAPVVPYKQKQQVTDNHSLPPLLSLRSHRPQYVARRSMRVSSVHCSRVCT